MTLIAIDPGATGAIAWQDGDKEFCMNMPRTQKDILDALRDIASDLHSRAVMEKVGTYMPGNSGPSAATFAEHVGGLKMALLALEIPFELILPRKWQDAFIGKQVYPPLPKPIDQATKRRIMAERKRDRKNKIKAKAQQVYPHIKVTLNNADALGMLWVAGRVQ